MLENHVIFISFSILIFFKTLNILFYYNARFLLEVFSFIWIIINLKMISKISRSYEPNENSNFLYQFRN